MRPGHTIVACALALLTLGVVMVTSASMTVDPKTPVTISSILLSRLTIYYGLALLTLALAAWLAPLGIISRLASRDHISTGAPASGWSLGPLWIGAVALVLVMAIVYVPGIGAAKKGSHRWLGINLPGMGELSIQPSEIAKWGLILLMAWYCATLGARRMGRFFTGLLPGLLAIAIVAGFLVLEDLGTGVLIAVASATVLLAGGARLWQFIALSPFPAIAFAAAVYNHPYRLDRIRSFLDPYADPDGKGYHMIQSMIAVANGDITGRGLGHGLQKFGYLPEDTTDFIFAIICEELGIPGAALVVFLYAALLWAGIAIVRRQRSVVLQLFGLGVVATVGFQALINLAVVTALGPTKGIALPLLSSGGTGWILTAAALGTLVAMDRASARSTLVPVAAPAAGLPRAAAPTDAPVDSPPRLAPEPALA
ncbi:MAG: FtsW/RodA/SpoVE family cell cycle protein [Phycisphaerae bacterium]|nr:FtsW/RodA/SpoVE family cell cycle protein [Phycisphaerae bacterium]